jgi:hypothetical protein
MAEGKQQEGTVWCVSNLALKPSNLSGLQCSLENFEINK